MKKRISFITVLFFTFNVYIAPSLTAITLGDIKSDKTEASDGKKTEHPEQKQDNVKKGEDLPVNRDQKKTDEMVNPRLVCLLSALTPGGGHFYLNKDLKGAGFCLAAGVGYTATGYFLVKTMISDVGSVEFKNYFLLTGFLFCISVVIHFIGIIEAYNDAEELNKQKIFGSDSDNPYITEFAME